MTESIRLPAVKTKPAAVALPGSKSISNRSLLLAALSDNVCEIHSLLKSDDTDRMLDALAALIVSEDELDKDNQILARKIIGVLKSQKILKGLGNNFGKFAKPNAAKDMAKIILTTVRRQGRRK